MNELGDLILAFAIIAVGCAAIGYVIFRAVTGTWLNTDQRLQDIDTDVQARIPVLPSEKQVNVVFDTYSGFLVYYRRTSHDFTAPRNQAEEILKRLHRYNLVHSWLAAGALLMPLVSYCNYRLQLHAIRKACEADSQVPSS
jgi:hypothetical protein